jgi:hypothetical protein
MERESSPSKRRSEMKSDEAIQQLAEYHRNKDERINKHHQQGIDGEEKIRNLYEKTGYFEPRDPALDVIKEAKRDFKWFDDADKIGILPSELVEGKNPISQLVRWCLQKGFDIGQTNGVEQCQSEIKEAHQNAIKSRAEFNRFAAFIDCCLMDGDSITTAKIDAFLKGTTEGKSEGAN